MSGRVQPAAVVGFARFMTCQGMPSGGSGYPSRLRTRLPPHNGSSAGIAKLDLRPGTRSGSRTAPSASTGALVAALLFQYLGAQIDTVFADEDTRWTGDEPAVSVGLLLPAEGADGVEVRAGTGSLPGHDAVRRIGLRLAGVM